MSDIRRLDTVEEDIVSVISSLVESRDYASPESRNSGLHESIALGRLLSIAQRCYEAGLRGQAVTQ